jgi:hypothetical protein
VRSVASILLVLTVAAPARAQFMGPPGLQGFGNGDSPYGTGSYGLGGQADLRSMGGAGIGGGDPRSQPGSFSGGFRSATRARRGPARSLPFAKRGPGANPLAQLDLLGAKATTALLPAELVAGLNSGPLTQEQAHALVSALIAADIESLQLTGTTYAQRAVAHRAHVPTSDPDVAELQAKVDELVPDPAGTTPDLPPRTLDQDALKSWFEALDVSKDHSITFLEWRDRTGLGLPLFRRIDTGADGVVEFDEFARALVLNAPGAKRNVDPELLAWATTATAAGGAEKEDTRKPADLLPPQGLDETLERARALLANATLQQAAKAAETAAPAAGAKGAAGKSADAKPKGDLFDLLRSGSLPKAKPTPKARPPLPMPTPEPSGH